MISLLFILLSFSYSESNDLNKEVVMKSFTPSGRIEALVDASIHLSKSFIKE